MELVWFVLFAVLLAGYFALEGFDLGVGMLLPFLGETPRDKDRMVAAIAPFVLANEVWLVAVAGTLFGVYPMLEGPVLSGIYPLVVGMLLAWILRDAGLWFRRRLEGAGWQRFWALMIAVGSAGLSFGWGAALSSLVAGSGLMAVLSGLVVMGLFAFHGWTFLGWRLPGFLGPGVDRTGWAVVVSGAVAAAPALAVVLSAAPYMMGSSAPAATLNVLSVMALPFAPIVALAQGWVWRTFGRGAVRTPSFF
ncbi:MAG: cytochrome d ubiquinol oxidase subunit II [Nonomuraea sp.]|nr:cytochrome d ubiquinol oxidase subunit II [Nonomuraea sp.]